MADHMAGFGEQPKLKKKQKLCLKVRKTFSDCSTDNVEVSSVCSVFSERTTTSTVIDLTEDEDTNVTDNR